MTQGYTKIGFCKILVFRFENGLKPKNINTECIPIYMRRD